MFLPIFSNQLKLYNINLNITSQIEKMDNQISIERYTEIQRNSSCVFSSKNVCNFMNGNFWEWTYFYSILGQSPQEPFIGF